MADIINLSTNPAGAHPLNWIAVSDTGLTLGYQALTTRQGANTYMQTGVIVNDRELLRGIKYNTIILEKLGVCFN